MALLVDQQLLLARWPAGNGVAGALGLLGRLALGVLLLAKLGRGLAAIARCHLRLLCILALLAQHLCGLNITRLLCLALGVLLLAQFGGCLAAVARIGLLGVQATLFALRLGVAVVGGGIIGYASAEALIRAGHDVTIYDARREGDATEVSAGILGAQFESDPESERFSPEQFSDRLEARSKYATWLKRLESETGRSVGFEEKKGVLRIARSEEEGAALKRLLQWQCAQGQKAEWFDRAALKAVHADLSKGIGAAFFPDDAVVDPAAVRGALCIKVGELRDLFFLR